MKRFRQWLSTVLAAESLLLCVFVSVMFVRSFWVKDAVGSVQYFQPDGSPIVSNRAPDSPADYDPDADPIAVSKMTSISTLEGECCVTGLSVVNKVIYIRPGWSWLTSTPIGSYRTADDHLGFLFEKVQTPTAVWFDVIFPIWALILLTMISPAIWIFRHRQLFLRKK